MESLNSELGTDSSSIIDTEMAFDVVQSDKLQYKEKIQDLNEIFNFSLTMNSTKSMIIFIHITCALSRPLLDISENIGSSWIVIFSGFSWLLYLFFVPGLLILLNRRKGALSKDDVILILPLSMMWILFLPALVQIVWFILNASTPIQWWNTGYISLLLTFVLFFRYSLRQNKYFSFEQEIKLPKNTTLMACFIMIILSILGPMRINYDGNNIISMLAILSIAVLPPIMSRNNSIDDSLILYCSALSILFTSSLVSNNVSGLDIQAEFYYSNAVINSGSIDLTSDGHYSTVLSTQGIIPLISLWTTIPVTYVLKIIYPMIFSYITILLYASYSNLFDRNVSYLATLLTIYSVSFYTSMLDVVRQGFSEIFLLSAILLMCSSDKLSMYRNRIFLPFFLFSMTLSHYGINYILYPVMWSGYFLFLILSYLRPFQYDDELTEVFDLNAELSDDDLGDIPIYSINNDLLLEEANILELEELQTRVKSLNPLLNFYHLISGTIFLLLWHGFAGGGSVLVTIIQYSQSIIPKFLEFGFFGAASNAAPTDFVINQLEPFHQITKYLYIIIMLCSLPSWAFTLFSKSSKRSNRNFLCLAFGSWVMFVFVFLAPNVAVRLHFPRIFHLLAIFIFPYSIYSLTDSNIKNYYKNLLNIRINVKLDMPIRIFFIIHLLLSSGFIYQLTDESHRFNLDQDMDYAAFSESEEAGSLWQSRAANDPNNGFDCKAADFYRTKLLLKHTRSYTHDSEMGLKYSEFTFLSGYNIENEELYLSYVGPNQENAITQHMPIENIFEEGVSMVSKIYDSGDSAWFYKGKCSI